LQDNNVHIREIERQYGKAADRYEQHDALESEIGERLLARISYLRREPERILDLGCGSGRLLRALGSRFEKAQLNALDLSANMLQVMRRRGSQKAKAFAVQGDLTFLPFAARSMDLVCSNMALQWAGDFTQALQEIRRVLRPEGMLLFSVPGPETLEGLRAVAGPGASANMPIYMPDLRDVGDLLLSTGFRDPVMDQELITVNYSSAAAMRRELEPTGGAGFAELVSSGPGSDAVSIAFEVVYGIAFGAPEGQPVRTGSGEVATFSVEQLTRKKKD
jgi:malonyl-CoA O-methyltransferase